MELVTLSNCLGDCRTSEGLLRSLDGVPLAGGLAIEMSAVNFVCPFGAALLLAVCQQAARASGRAVQLLGLQRQVHAYLRRVSFFDCGAGAVVPGQPFDEREDFYRSEASWTVLELTPIRSPQDIYAAKDRVRQILGAWIGEDDSVNQIVICLSEACENVIDHSGSEGLLVVQKYSRRTTGIVEVQLAITDVGAGIPATLRRAHADIDDTPAGYIRRALQEGLSSRERGGLGLGTIRDLATRGGGSVHIRSETARVRALPSRTLHEDGLPFLPGTQLAVTLCARP